MRATHRSHGPEPTAAVAYIGRNGKYISSRAKSPLHTPRVAGPERAFDSNEPWPPPHCRAQFYHRSSAAPSMQGTRCVARRARPRDARVLPACWSMLLANTRRPWHRYCRHRLTLLLRNTIFRCNFRFFPLASRNSRGK